jgi:NAD-dependent deacetylase
MRCAADCGGPGAVHRWPIPDGVPTVGKGDPVTPEIQALLVCPRCGQMARPHVLWFDESYDEPRYFFDTVLGLARCAALVIVAGTSAQTSLPWHVVQLASAAGATIVDVNLEDNPFGDIAARSGGVIRGPSAGALTAIVDALISR